MYSYDDTHQAMSNSIEISAPLARDQMRIPYRTRQLWKFTHYNTIDARRRSYREKLSNCYNELLERMIQ